MHFDTRQKMWIWISLILSLIPITASAHVGQGDVSGGFFAGFKHPISGLDHVVAMVAVGLWGAQLA
jgi:urease accessory protein